MREKHLTLRDNIGTFAKEDEAFDLLIRLSWQLPIFVITSAIIDLVLAFVYLKWLHPWKIILQEASGNCVFPSELFHQEPEKWGPESEQESVLVNLNCVWKFSSIESIDLKIFQEKKEEAFEMATFPDSSSMSQVKERRMWFGLVLNFWHSARELYEN